MPATIWTVNRFPPDLSRANDYLPVLMTFLRFRHVISGSLVFVSIGTYLTKSSFAFSVTLTTMAFDHSNLRWFGASTCIAVPRGPPSSTVKHGTRPLPSWRTVISVPYKVGFTSAFPLYFHREPQVQDIVQVNIRQCG